MIQLKIRSAKFALWAIVLWLAQVSAIGSPEIIPTAVGNKWEYTCVKLVRATIMHQDRTIAGLKDASSGHAVYEIVSVDTGAARPVYDYRETTELRSTDGDTDTDKDELKITRDDAGLRILSTYGESAGGGEPDKQTYDPPLLYYPKDAAVGRSWEVGTVRDGDTSSVITARGAGKETVTVPAGTFKDCLKVVYSSEDISGTMEMWDQTFKMTSGRMRGIYWIADGVGVVKELEVSISTAEAVGPQGNPVTIEAAACTVTELKPGYVVKK